MYLKENALLVWTKYATTKLTAEAASGQTWSPTKPWNYQTTRAGFWQYVWLISAKDNLNKTVILLHKDIYRHLLLQQHQRPLNALRSVIFQDTKKCECLIFALCRQSSKADHWKHLGKSSPDPQKWNWRGTTLKCSGHLMLEVLTWTVRKPRRTTIQLKPDYFFS